LQARDQLQIGFSSPSSEQLLFLIWQLLQYDPRKRLTPAEALGHPYFAEEDHAHPEQGDHPNKYPTSRALQTQSTETTLQPPRSDEPNKFECPLCSKTFDLWNSCHQHVTKRKHGHRCQYHFNTATASNSLPFTCLSSHSLLPLDETSGYCDIQGRRSVIEDFHSIELNGDGTKFYGVFDGHRGNLAAKFAAKFLISDLKDVASANLDSYNNFTISRAFENLNSELLRRHPSDDSGSTATVAIKLADRLVVANIGDSRAILCSKNSGFRRQLTVDHNPANDNERNRILESGGEVASAGGILRVGGLAVSRAFGDSNVQGVISEPHSDFVHIPKECPDSSCFVILASDGLWDVVSNDDACLLTNDTLGEGGTFQDAAEALTLEAWVRGSMDNIGVCVVDI